MPNELIPIQKILENHPEIRLAYVFGSVALDRADFNSDLDIAIDTFQPLSATERIQLIEELAMATGRTIDLVDLKAAGEPLLGEILRNGQRLKGNNHQHAELITRHIFDNEDFMPYVRRMLAERRHRMENTQ